MERPFTITGPVVPYFLPSLKAQSQSQIIGFCVDAMEKNGFPFPAFAGTSFAEMTGEIFLKVH